MLLIQPVKVNRTVTPVPPRAAFAFSLLLWFRLSNKAHKRTNTLLFRSICCGFVCSTKHQKAQYRALACKYVSAQCHSVMYSPPCPPTRRAYHAFAAFSVLLWFRLFHKAPKSTNTLLFRAVCCGFVCSTKHQNAPKLVFRAHWFQHRATVLCVRLHSEPPSPSQCFLCFGAFSFLP